VLVGKKKKKMS